jgi:hypothetical protein
MSKKSKNSRVSVSRQHPRQRQSAKPSVEISQIFVKGGQMIKCWGVGRGTHKREQLGTGLWNVEGVLERRLRHVPANTVTVLNEDYLLNVRSRTHRRRRS